MILNQPRAWLTVDDCVSSGYTGGVTLISKDGTCHTSMLGYWFNGIAGFGAKLIIEDPDIKKMTVCGSVMRAIGGLWLDYSKGRMLRSSGSPYVRANDDRLMSNASGLYAAILLRSFCDPYTYEDIMDLLDADPDCVIDFAAYTYCLGCLPHRNSILWKVRRV